MKNITLRAFICTFILGLLGNSSTFAQEDYGNLCGETIDILFEQSENPFAVSPTSSTFLGAGQSFQTDAAYEIGGIFILVSKPPSWTVVMDVGYAVKKLYLEDLWLR